MSDPFVEQSEVGKLAYKMGGDAERERLNLMAETADTISINLIGDSIAKGDVTLGDVGAGLSTSLGEKLVAINPDLLYLPIDKNPEAVTQHTSAGFLHAVEGFATNLPLPDNFVHIVHSRFTMAWLPKSAREQAMEEALRVSTDGSKLIFIDYDWGAAQNANNPPPVKALINKLIEITKILGFDPYFGAKANSEVKETLARLDFDESDAHVEEVVSPVQDTMSNSLHTVRVTVESLVPVLVEIGLADELEELGELLSGMGAYALSHPEELLTFPSMVGIVVDNINPAARQKVLEGIRQKRSRLGSEAVNQEVMRSIGPSSLRAFKLTSKEMKLKAMQLHARAYRDHGHVTAKGIDPEDNTLINAIDPHEVRRDSTYIGVVEKGKVQGCIRLINAAVDNPYALPTLTKLREAGERKLQESGDNSLLTLLDELPFIKEDALIFEGSALGKAHEGGPTVMSRLFLAIICEAADRGFEYGVVGLVGSTAKLLKKVYGEQAFKRIGDESTQILLEGEGLKEGGVILEPYYVKVSTFMEDCLNHFEWRRGNSIIEANIPLFEEALQFMQRHEGISNAA